LLPKIVDQVFVGISGHNFSKFYGTVFIGFILEFCEQFGLQNDIQVNKEKGEKSSIFKDNLSDAETY